MKKLEIGVFDRNTGSFAHALVEPVIEGWQFEQLSATPEEYGWQEIPYQEFQELLEYGNLNYPACLSNSSYWLKESKVTVHFTITFRDSMKAILGELISDDTLPFALKEKQKLPTDREGIFVEISPDDIIEGISYEEEEDFDVIWFFYNDPLLGRVKTLFLPHVNDTLTRFREKAISFEILEIQ